LKRLPPGRHLIKHDDHVYAPEARPASAIGRPVDSDIVRFAPGFRPGLRVVRLD